MMNTVRSIVREGRIQLLEETELPEGTEVLVTPLIDERDFWRRASESSLDACGTIPKTTYMPNYSRNEVVLVRPQE